MSEVRPETREGTRVVDPSDVPSQPGVYIMRDTDERVIYVGKAKILRNRVRSYFVAGRDRKTQHLVSRIRTVEYIVTRTEYEALVLENTLIKKWKPRYNINLKDGKSYPVIRVTADDYPRVFRTRRIVRDGSDYFGPFPDIGALETYLEVVDKHFPLRKCRGPLKLRRSPCLYYHIGRCPAPCVGKVSKEEYGEQVEKVRRLLRGEHQDLIDDLESRMAEAAQNRHYEEAARHRDAIRAIARLVEGQHVEGLEEGNRDYVAVHTEDDVAVFVVFRVLDGRLQGTDTFRTAAVEDEPDLLAAFVTQYYGETQPPASTVFVDSTDELADLPTFFKDRFGFDVVFAVPEARRDRALLNMAKENARLEYLRSRHENESPAAVAELQRVLSLKAEPNRIEGFDIAHIDGKHTVASMVTFLSGRPAPNEYRRFRIRSLNGKIDDFESMREVVARRYMRVLNENLPRPDLILIDGGKGQVGAAYNVLRGLGLGDIPIVGLAKRYEEIFRPNEREALQLPEGTPPLQLLQHVRDEAHRFATTYNQALRTKDIQLDTLQSVAGFGPKKAAAILQEFGGLEEVAEAEPEYIARVARVSEDRADVLRATIRSVLQPPE